MSENQTNKIRQASFIQALLCFSGVIGIISIGLFLFEIDLHSLMFLCLTWAVCNAIYLGYSWQALREMMSAAITRALPAIYIFLLIGMVIASFMQCGTIAALMYYGLNWLGPTSFLPIGLILCAIMSVATGTSWGTVGTLGVVFIGIGSALGIPLPIVAGMVVCGATFGDKMSPISDTTNLAAMSAGTNLYRHIYSMMFTTAPSFLIAFFIFLFIGISHSEGGNFGFRILEIQQALLASYGLAPIITLAPIILLAVLSIRKVAAEIAMSSSVLLALCIAIAYQGQSPVDVLNALWINTPGNTGISSLDDLLGRGGIYSMSWTLMLALMALALGGILHGSKLLDTLLAGLISRIQHVTGLIFSTIVTGFMGNIAMGEAYISIILSCQLFKAKYEQMELDEAILSRSVEEGSTLTTGLIPWTTAGAFYAATLGVPVLEYAPYAFFNYMNAFISVGMAFLGIGLLGKSSQTPKNIPS